MNLWTPLKHQIRLAVFWGLVLVGMAEAQVHLSFTPADTTIAQGQSGRLSVMVADTLAIRTVDVVVTYDDTVVRSLGGSAGALYTDSGIFTFKGFEEDTLGTWHGYAVLMGAGLFIEGPGELYYWDFEGLADGSSPIISVKANVSTTDGSWFSDVYLPPTTVIVGNPLTAVSDVPETGHRLALWPNPFNPRTEVRFELQRDSWVRLAVFDTRGREVVVLRDGFTTAGLMGESWDGRDGAGRIQAGGVYLFLLQTDDGITSTKGVLLK